MASLSSSFLSTFLLPNSTIIPLQPPPPQRSLLPPPPSPFRVSCIQTDEKPQPVMTTFKISTQDRTQRSTTTLDNEKSVKISATIDRSLLSTIFNALDDVINRFIDPPLRDSVNPRHVLSDNFYPVEELPPTDCEVTEGLLPSCLDGVYIRNGSNPQFLPRGPYHLFDGDGMLHAIRISKGKATLCSRYVKTYKYNIEKNAGFPMIPNIFAGFNGLTASVARLAIATGRFLAGHFDPSQGIGSANTSLAFFGNKLYALGESDLPYAVKLSPDGDITTLGRDDFDGKLSMRMTAHPKIDPVTKEAFGFRYSPISPFLIFFRFDKHGEKQADVPIFSMTTPCFLHDFAITKNYAVFPEIQLKIDLFGSGSLVHADLKKVPRIGIIPRYAEDDSEMKWFEVSGWNSLHTVNAWEEDGGDTVVMVATNVLSIEHLLERMDLMHASVEMVRINTKTGTVSRQPLSTRNLDFAVINPAFVGVKNRYTYCGIGNPMPKITGVVKLDMSLSEVDHQECIVGCRMFGPGCFGGEPFFVAKEPDNPDADEDDGYIVSLVHDEHTGESRFLVMDAKSPSLEIVCVVKLPHRVPYGFHGLFVKESDINKL